MPGRPQVAILTGSPRWDRTGDRRHLVTLAPWEYLFVAFNAANFPDLFWPMVVVSVALLVGQVVLYNVRIRQLRKHEPLVTLNEWLLWTGVIVFSLLVIEALFVWYFAFVLATILVGLVVFFWVRFFRFPPMIAEYNEYLRRTRFFSQEKYKHPEATIRPRRRRRR